MKSKNLTLVVILVLIVTSIYYLEKQKPTEDLTKVDADIKIEEIISVQEPIHESLQESNVTANTSPEEEQSKTQVLSSADKDRITIKSKKYERAKELVSPNGFLNTPELTISQNIGKKVILVDFWTYSCVNCQRTLPYLNQWQEKYSDKGLLILGVHTPEFEFEKNYDNLQKAIEKYEIDYPVVQDNEKRTWKAYKNRYWPRKYLIDIDGFIVYDHIGEGAYAETEEKIQELLDERNKVLGEDLVVKLDLVKQQDAVISSGKTREIYFGYAHDREQFGNEEGFFPDDVGDYLMPAQRERNKFYLGGSWKNNEDNMEAIKNSLVKLGFKGRQINLVAGSDKSAIIKVDIDGKMSEITVSDFDLYNLAQFDENEEHELKLTVPDGVMLYTFTFG